MHGLLVWRIGNILDKDCLRGWWDRSKAGFDNKSSLVVLITNRVARVNFYRVR